MKVAHLSAIAARAGGTLERQEKVEPPKAPPAPATPAVDMAVVARAIERLPSMLPPPTMVEVPAQINTEQLAQAIAQAMRSSQPQTKPVSWRFTVKRDVDGLIESIDASPRK